MYDEKPTIDESERDFDHEPESFAPDPSDPTYSARDGRWQQLVDGEWKSGSV